MSWGNRVSIYYLVFVTLFVVVVHAEDEASLTKAPTAVVDKPAALPSTAPDIFIPEGNPDQTLEGMLIAAKGVAVDFDGNVYVADTQNHVVRKYSPTGVPLAVFGRETQSGFVDGSPVEARFKLPTRLATDKDGHILVVDQNNQSRIRRINVNTLQTTTVADLSTNVDATNAYDVFTGFTRNLGILNNVEIGDIAAHPNGDLFVSATDLISARIRQYLIRITLNGTVKQVIAYTSMPPNSSEKTGSRGLAIDHQGNVFTAFTDKKELNGDTVDSIYRFPAGTTTGVSQHYHPGGVIRAMGAGLGNQLYLFTPDPTGLINVISTDRA